MGKDFNFFQHLYKPMLISSFVLINLCLYRLYASRTLWI